MDLLSSQLSEAGYSARTFGLVTVNHPELTIKDDVSRLVQEKQTGLVSVKDPKATFFADVVEPLASKAASQILPQSLLSFNTPSSETYYGITAYDNRRTYLHTNQDQALPPFAQDAFVAGSGVTWNVQKLDTSHSPFFSEPKQLADIVVSNVKAFLATY
ncbi:MAG: hypothetical protein Q9181_005501 [Wetmoreana brouardii]